MNILLADHRSKVRYALRVLLEQQPGWTVIGEAADAGELFARTQRLLPDLILVDSGLPGLDEAGWLARLRQICPPVRIVVMSEQPGQTSDDPAAFSDAYASKVNPPERLLSVIRALNGLRHSAC